MRATWKKSSGSGLENRLTAVGDPPRWPRDTPLSANVGTKFRWQVAVAMSMQFACGQRPTDYFFEVMFLHRRCFITARTRRCYRARPHHTRLMALPDTLFYGQVTNNKGKTNLVALPTTHLRTAVVPTVIPDGMYGELWNTHPLEQSGGPQGEVMSFLRPERQVIGEAIPIIDRRGTSRLPAISRHLTKKWRRGIRP
jgi:hypothetical protein